MSTVTLLPSNAGSVVLQEQGLDTDNPLALYKKLYPRKSDAEVKEAVNDLYLRTLAPMVKNVHALPLDDLIRESGLSKPEVDILCIVMLEGDAMFDSNAQKLYDEAIYTNAHFIMESPYEISSRDLYKNMLITR